MAESTVKIMILLDLTELMNRSFPDIMRSASLGDDGKVMLDREEHYGGVTLGKVVGEWVIVE